MSKKNKLRLIEEYDPIDDKSNYYVEQYRLHFPWGWWSYVPNTVELTEEKARAKWVRIKTLGSVERVKRTLEELG